MKKNLFFYKFNFFIIKNNITKHWPIFKRRFCFWYISGRWVFRKTSSQTERRFMTGSPPSVSMAPHSALSHFLSLGNFSSFTDFLPGDPCLTHQKTLISELWVSDLKHSPDRGEGEGDGVTWGFLGGRGPTHPLTHHNRGILHEVKQLPTPESSVISKIRLSVPAALGFSSVQVIQTLYPSLWSTQGGISNYNRS